MTHAQYDVYKCKRKSKYLLTPAGTDITTLDIEGELKEDLEEFGSLDFLKQAQNKKGAIGAPSIEEINEAFEKDGYIVTTIDM